MVKSSPQTRQRFPYDSFYRRGSEVFEVHHALVHGADTSSWWGRGWELGHALRTQKVLVRSPILDGYRCIPTVKLLSHRRAATRRLHSFQWGKGGRGEAVTKAAVNQEAVAAHVIVHRFGPNAQLSPGPSHRRAEPSASEAVIRAVAARRCASTLMVTYNGKTVSYYKK